MTHIKHVSIIGLGALGILFGQQLNKKLPAGSLKIIADPDRSLKYIREGIYSNGERCNFEYISPEDEIYPADLLIFAVKCTGLEEAIRAARKQVGQNTIIMSLLNGISSEELIGRHYGEEKLLYAVAQGMDAVKEGNCLTYHNMGLICFGGPKAGTRQEMTEAVHEFFTETGIPHEVCSDMKKRMWGKLMLNVGVNQTAAVFKCCYEGLQNQGQIRDTMIAAMEEVYTLSQKEGVNLTREDIAYWLSILDGLNPKGKPSMQQDIEAGRKTEVELFAGTILSLGNKHGIGCPVNQMLYDKITEMEGGF
jgi:2-dehydropantoate 2-reductase